MPANNQTIVEQFQEMIAGVFRRGSRYQTEKIAVLVAFFTLSIASVVWGVSGQSQDNELGATFGKSKLEELSKDVFFLSNDSSETWTRIRLVLNRRYLYTRDKLAGADRATLGNTDFAYFYYIPRAWGQDEWELLEAQPKPKAHAPDDLSPTFVQLRAEQGKLDIDLTRAATPSN